MPRKAAGLLKPEMFAGKYKTLAESIWSQVQKYGEVDPILSAQESGISMDELFELKTLAVNLSQAVFDVFDRFYKKHISKQLSAALHDATKELISGAKHGETMAVLEAKYKAITANKDFQDKRNEQLIETVKDIERSMASDKNLLGPSTGYATFDERLGGWPSSHLIYLAGRPGMGKTSLSICMAYETAKSGAGVGIISLEMSVKELRKKLLATATGLSYSDISRGKLTENDFKKINAAKDNLSQMEIHIENPSSEFEGILDLMYQMKESFNIELFIIDYMQLMRKDGYKNDRNGEISYISRRLKESAGQDRLNACIVCLSQLNRESQMGVKGKTPSLHNLRDSGSLEQDADAVLFVHRPEYYNILQDEMGESTKNLVMAIFEKNRHGETGTVNLWRSDNFSRIYEQNQTPQQFPVPQSQMITHSNNQNEVPF